MKEESLEKYKLELKELESKADKSFKKICCPSCDADVPADNININDKIAKCNSCDVVFPFQQEIEGLLQNRSFKHEVLRPEGIDIFHYEDELDFSVQQPISLFDSIMLTFLPILAFFTTLIFFKDDIPVFWPIGFWTGSVFFLLRLFPQSRNRILINIDSRNLTIRWRPRKFHRDKSYSIHDVDQLYTKNSGYGGFDLYMTVNGLDGQKHVKLIQNLKSLSKARYLEQEIEHHLGIVDRKIPGELE